MEFWHKKPFSIRFVHKFRKFSNFEPTLDYIMLRNFGTVRLIFPKIAPKVAQDLKEKSHKSSRREKKFPRNYRAKRRGGGDSAPPPPPALLGLNWRNKLKPKQGSIWQTEVCSNRWQHCSSSIELLNQNPHVSTKKLWLSRSSLQRIFRCEVQWYPYNILATNHPTCSSVVSLQRIIRCEVQWYSYKMHLCHQLFEADKPKCLQYRQWLLNPAPSFQEDIIIGDEA